MESNIKTKAQQIEQAWNYYKEEVYPFDHPLAGSYRGCCIDCDWGEDAIMETLWREEVDWFHSIGIHDTDECSLWGWVNSSRFYKKPEETEVDLNLPVASIPCFQP